MRKTKAKSNPSALRIEGEMTIYRALELKKVLLDAVAGTEVLDIDLSAVNELDSAGVQLLVLAKKTAQAKQHQVRLAAHSPAVIEVFELLDLFSYFGDPLVI